MTTNNTFSNQKREGNNTFCKINVKEDNIFYKDCCDKFIDYVKKSHNEQDLERVADSSKTITVEKEVYEAVLRNSVKVADLEAENMQLRQFCEGFNTLEVSEENRELKELLKKCNETFFEIRLSLASGKINSVFDLSRQRENDIKEVLNVPSE